MKPVCILGSFSYYLQVCLRRTLLMAVREQLVLATRWKSITSIMSFGLRQYKQRHVF